MIRQWFRSFSSGRCVINLSQAVFSPARSVFFPGNPRGYFQLDPDCEPNRWRVNVWLL
jgi:hypothetical protein